MNTNNSSKQNKAAKKAAQAPKDKKSSTSSSSAPNPKGNPSNQAIVSRQYRENKKKEFDKLEDWMKDNPREEVKVRPTISGAGRDGRLAAAALEALQEMKGERDRAVEERDEAIEGRDHAVAVYKDLLDTYIAEAKK